MGSNWREYSISDLVEIIGGGTPKTSVSEFWGGNIPWLSVVDFNNDSRWVSKTEKTITEIGLKESSTKILKKGQIIISARGTVGALAQLDKDMAFNQSCYGLNGRPCLINNDFLYYAIKNVIGTVKKNTHGAVFDTITRETFNNIKIAVPSIKMQVEISSFLGCLDKKIELNRQMNQTLENIASAIFKSWFVDFDPVRAKMAGREPEGMNPEIAALFPDKLVDSPLGLIPEGWGVLRLGDVIDFCYGKALKAENRKNGNIPVYGSNGIIGWHNEPLIVGPGIIVGRKGNPGVIKFSTSDFFPIDTSFYVRLKNNLSSMSFTWLLLETLNLPVLSSDSAVPGLNRNAAFSKNIVLPHNDLILRFEQIIMALLCQYSLNTKLIHVLFQIKNTLLPKLILGELKLNMMEMA